MDKLRNMEVMVAVVEAGSFAAAARQLQISAVMVGKHIQQLEAHLGARLFQRSTRQNSLTEVGAAFYEDSKRVLEQVRWAESAVERSRAAPQGLLRVSAPMTLGSAVIAPLVAQFLRKHAANTAKRIFYGYFLRNFSLASLELLLGPLFLLLGAAVGAVGWARSLAAGQFASSGTVMLAALPILVGVQLLLAFFGYDMQNVPREPLRRRLAGRPGRRPPP